MEGIFGRDSLWEDDHAGPTYRKRSLNVHTNTSIMGLFCLVTERKGLGDETFGTLNLETTGRRVCEVLSEIKPYIAAISYTTYSRVSVLAVPQSSSTSLRSL